MSKGASSEEERFLQTKESLINTLYSRKNAEKEYLSTVKKLLNYWESKLETANPEDKKRKDKLLELINTEEDTIKKIGNDINRINEVIDQTEKNLEKIKGMVDSI